MSKVILVNPQSENQSSPSINVPLDFLVITGVGVLFVVAVSVIKILISREFNQVQERFKEIESENKSQTEQIQALKLQFTHLQEHLRSGYLPNESFARFAGTTDAKLDTLHRQMTQRIDQVMMAIADIKRGDK